MPSKRRRDVDAADVNRTDRPANRPAGDGRTRVVVERVLPEIDAGRFPIKRTPGEIVEVMAHVHADGHDVLSVRLRYRHQDGDAEWTAIPMLARGNDEWTASFAVDRVGVYEYVVDGWIDQFLTWRHGLDAKVRAGLPVVTELQEGAALVAAAAQDAGPAVRRRVGRSSGAGDSAAEPTDRAQLEQFAILLVGEGDQQDRVHAALDTHLRELMARHPNRARASTYSRYSE